MSYVESKKQKVNLVYKKDESFNQFRHLVINYLYTKCAFSLRI